jgi:GNAT superfamily N-acetyltransferase
VDSQLVRAGCYFVARVRGEIVGCGGWSPFVTLFGADHMPGRDDQRLDPAVDAARIRAFFVAPDWTRAGVGSALLDLCEMEALEAGYTRVTLMATLSGTPFYLSRGYAAQEDYVAKLGGANIRFVPMQRSLLTGSRTAHPIKHSLAIR